jgi:hypothetical protein
MHFDTHSLIFFSLLAVFLGLFGYRILKYGGFKGAVFGGRIERTLGEVRGTGRAAGNVKVRVHALAGGGEDRAVGVEFVATTIVSYQMFPITLSAKAAQDLIGLLQDALGNR